MYFIDDFYYALYRLQIGLKLYGFLLPLTVICRPMGNIYNAAMRQNCNLNEGIPQSISFHIDRWYILIVHHCSL